MFTKPLFLIGNGCRNNPELIKKICRLNVPIMVTWMALDLIEEELPVYVGRPGTLGDRGANIILQKCDSIYIMGARLDNDQVAFRLNNFAKNSQRFVYDIDINELKKYPDNWNTFCVDLSNENIDFSIKNNPEWLSWCKKIYNKYRTELDGNNNGDFIDPMYFVNKLSEEMLETDILALGSSGFAPVTFLRGFKVKKGQRVTGLSTLGPMGADIPMGIGVCLASGGKRTIIPTGDGGAMMNIQSLELIKRLNLPIKIIIYNNSGYASIRVMQNLRFEGRKVSCDKDSGLYLPSYQEIANSFNIDYKKIEKMENWNGLKNNNPEIIELMIDPDYPFAPKVGTIIKNGKFETASMENMTPPLANGELEKLMEE